jgi:predicted DNA-binding transcriptional regulator YafY
MIPLEERMKKSARVQQELFFINENKSFQLKDLMRTFNISKSTALRDIEDLEQLGVPLYAENGRYGGYKVIHNALLPPIYFSEDEIFAIFYSLQLLKLLTDSPFGDAYANVQQKLLNTFSAARQKKIAQMIDCVQYEGVMQIESTRNLGQIFSSILKNELIKMQYSRYGRDEKRIIPARLILMDGYWYCIAFDVNKSQWRTYRCDFMKDIEIEVSNQKLFSDDELRTIYQVQKQHDRAYDFKVQVSEEGKAYFLKRKFSNMSLKIENNINLIVGSFNPNELNFLANYFLGFGENAEILAPESLKNEYLKCLKRILKKYQV